ncbi:MAG: hypothetical protein ABJO02_20025 [Reichenbachiella sp.]|uniref:hypothetical protein n=1 Tax=Reichenbachiella sp. TaxID=2184521 RepID=UPI00329742CE
MGTFFDQIGGLDGIPEFNFGYAETVLKLVVKGLLELDEIDVGISTDEEENIAAIITFTSDEFETVLTELTYNSDSEYEITIVDNSEEFRTCSFKYCLSSHQALIELIPEGLREFMKEVKLSGENAVLKPRTLK